jgi:CheY-like chemotaxis protein
VTRPSPSAGSTAWRASPHSPAPELSAAANPFWYGPSVLLVDDSAVSRYVTCALLGRWGIMPKLAFDGAEAVRLARSHALDLDLVLMDIQMPVMDGLAATACIRSFEREHSYPRVPVVAYTSSAIAGKEDFLRESGMDAVLEKPCPSTSLRECLLRWCPPRNRVEGGVRPPVGGER